jgi:hypothetical protein
MTHSDLAVIRFDYDSLRLTLRLTTDSRLVTGGADSPMIHDWSVTSVNGCDVTVTTLRFETLRLIQPLTFNGFLLWASQTMRTIWPIPWVPWQQKR